MKKIYVLLFVLLPFFGFSQSGCNCSASLEKLYTSLQKTPSYKDQVKGSVKELYIKLYPELKTKATAVTDNFEYYQLLAQLVYPLKDNHMGLHFGEENEFNSDSIFNAVVMKRYKESAAFKDFPRTNRNLDSLQNALKDKTLNEVEGIYQYAPHLTAAVYRNGNSNTFTGVITASKLLNWESGQIAFILTEKSPNQFNALHTHFIKKFFMLVKSEEFSNGSLIAYGWTKLPGTKNFATVINSNEKFVLKDINNTIQYLRLGTFRNSDEVIAQANAFFKEINGKLTAPNLIVDLRGNTGGYDNVSGQFLKMLKKYAGKNRVYILANRHIASNAEQFIIKLKKQKNVLLLGENTAGVVAYGNNTGYEETLVCDAFTFIPTDMDFSKYLPYEEEGITPDVALKPDSDWIEQAVAIVAAKHI